MPFGYISIVLWPCTNHVCVRCTNQLLYSPLLAVNTLQDAPIYHSDESDADSNASDHDRFGGADSDSDDVGQVAEWGDEDGEFGGAEVDVCPPGRCAKGGSKSGSGGKAGGAKGGYLRDDLDGDEEEEDSEDDFDAGELLCWGLKRAGGYYALGYSG